MARHLRDSESEQLVKAISQDLALTAVEQIEERQKSICINCLGKAYLEGMIKAASVVFGVAACADMGITDQDEINTYTGSLINHLIDAAAEFIE